MSEQALNIGALPGGILIGLLFFGGLWWTVQKARSSRQPGLLFAGSMLLRTVVSLAAFYLIGSGSWQRLLACLIGFTLARVLVKRCSQAFLNPDCAPVEEGAR